MQVKERGGWRLCPFSQHDRLVAAAMVQVIAAKHLAGPVDDAVVGCRFRDRPTPPLRLPWPRDRHSIPLGHCHSPAATQKARGALEAECKQAQWRPAAALGVIDALSPPRSELGTCRVGALSHVITRVICTHLHVNVTTRCYMQLNAILHVNRMYSAYCRMFPLRNVPFLSCPVLTLTKNSRHGKSDLGFDSVRSIR